MVRPLRRSIYRLELGSVDRVEFRPRGGSRFEVLASGRSPVHVARRGPRRSSTWDVEASLDLEPILLVAIALVARDRSSTSIR